MSKIFVSLGLASLLLAGSTYMTAEKVKAQAPNEVNIGGVDLNRYCQDRWENSYADLIEHTAWGWRCFDRNKRHEISVQKACEEQYDTYPVVTAYATNHDDPYSWGCFIPTTALP